MLKSTNAERIYARRTVKPWSQAGEAAVPWLLPGIMALALLGWGAVALWGDTQRAWAILIVDFLFLSSLSAGLVVWPAIVLVSRGTWMGSTQRTALAGVVLLPFCVLLLIVLFLGITRLGALVRSRIGEFLVAQRARSW